MITIQFVGPVRRPGPERKIEVSRKGLRNIHDLLAHLGYSEEEQLALNILADGVRVSHDTTIEEINVVEIYIAIGGG